MSIKGLDPNDVYTLGTVLGIVNDGVGVAKSKGFDVDLQAWLDEDGYYEQYLDVIVRGRRVRLHTEFVDKTDDQTRGDLMSLLRELS